jgi:hypothetical protein
MPTRTIDTLIWTALTDPDFQARLLNGHRAELLATLKMTDVERQAVLSVKADSLESFAEALCPPLEVVYSPAV